MSLDQSTGEIPDPLTDAEYAELESLETVVSKGLAGFVEVGTALATIRDKKLYRQYHGSFAAYCEDQWQLGKTKAYDLIQGAEVVEKLSAIADTPLPQNEGQARALKPVKDQPKKAAEAMRKATEDGPATAEKIAAAVEEVIDPDMAIREAKEADRKRRVAEKAEKAEREKYAIEHLAEIAAEQFDDVRDKAVNAATRDAIDALLDISPQVSGFACPDSQKEARLLYLDQIVFWVESHRHCIEDGGATLHSIGENQ